MPGDRPPPDNPPDYRRRRALKYLLLAGLAGSGVAGAWFVTRPDESQESLPTPRSPQPSPAQPDQSGTRSGSPPAIVREFAPDLYFGQLEKWYPTDPRPYVIDTDTGPVVDGFTALEEYAAAFDDPDDPPDPIVFYHVVEAATGVDAIQYWMYSVFDQFTVNFHWHDWELLQIFIDQETERPLLVSASAHSRSVPNNEFVAPAFDDDRHPGILSEVGSHSSASEINTRVPSFDRVTNAALTADITNDFLDVTADVAIPFAYGLPRGEGARLPFVMPELDGRRLDRHPRLGVDRDDFIDNRVTVTDWLGIPQPPTHLPLRQPGLVMAAHGSPVDADVRYDLKPLQVVREAVDDFSGPQLSFEFVIPGVVEDQVANYITSVGIPWEQERFSNPLADVTDPTHRRRIDGREPPGLRNRVVGRVRQLQSGTAGALDGVPEEARDALADEISVSLYALPAEVGVFLSSPTPVATVSRMGVFGFLHVTAGEHRVVINGPGYAPFGVRIVHDGGVLRVGASGEVTVVARGDAAWIRGTGRGNTDIDRVRISEDYAGTIFAGRPIEADQFAAAVHRRGNYTVDIIDTAGRRGAYRVTRTAFADDRDILIDPIETGKASLVASIVDLLVELRALAESLGEEDQAEGAVIERVSLALEYAEAAAASIQRGSAGAANEELVTARSFLEEALDLLGTEGQDGYSDSSVSALRARIRDVIERIDIAIETEIAL